MKRTATIDLASGRMVQFSIGPSTKERVPREYQNTVMNASTATSRRDASRPWRVRTATYDVDSGDLVSLTACRALLKGQQCIGSPAKLDLVIRRVPGDGSCFFHALVKGLKALGLSGHTAASLRKDVVRKLQWLLNLPQYREQLLLAMTDTANTHGKVNAVDVPSYLKSMQDPKTFAGMAEIMAAVHVLKRHIVVVTLWEGNTSGRNIVVHGDERGDFHGETPLVVLYTGRNHYDALVNRGGTTKPTDETITINVPKQRIA